MKNILCILLLTGALAAQAQMPANDLLRHIPADADQVVDVNLGAIVSKIDLLALMNMAKSKTMNNKDVAKMTQLLNSGIDAHQSLIFAGINSNKEDSIKYQVFILHLTDSAKFAATARNMAKENAEPIHYLHPMAKLRVAVRGHDAIAWTDKLAILVMATSPKNTSGTPQPLATLQARAARRCAMALEGFATTKFITDEHFTTTFADGGDIHIWNLHGGWANMMNKIMQKMPADKMGQMGALSQMMHSGKGQGQSIGTLRFDNGSIKYTTLKFMPPNELATMKVLVGQGLNPRLLSLVPPRQILGVAAIHYDMAALEDTIKRNPMYPMIDTMLKSKGVSVMDILHTFKGDFMVLVCSPDKNAPADTTGKKKMPTPTFYLVATINSKTAFEKIAPVIKIKDVSAVTADQAAADTTNRKHPLPYYSVQNDILVLGKYPQASEFFTHGTNSDQAGKLLPDQPTANLLTMGIDIHAFLTGMLGPMLGSGDQGDGQKLMQTIGQLQTLQLSVGAIRGDAMESKFELRFADQNKNSLTTLIDMVNTISGKSAGAPPAQ